MFWTKSEARVAAFGTKFSSNYLAKTFNPFLELLFKLGSSTTPRPDYEPWRVLAKRVEGLDFKEYFFGFMFLASGSVSKKSLDPEIDSNYRRCAESYTV